MNRYTAIALSVLIAIAIIAMHLVAMPEPEVVGTTSEARQATEVKKETTIPLDIQMVKVFEPEVKTKLKLPQAVIKDPGKHVISATKVVADNHPHTISTVLDKSTGEFTTYDRKDPLPWLAVKTTTHLAAYYGLKNGQEAIRIQWQQEILQMKSLHIEGTASVDIGAGKPDTFIGIGGRFSF